MSTHRPPHPSAFLEMAGVAVVWAVLLFAIALGAVLIVLTMFASQIGAVFRIFGITLD